MDIPHFFLSIEEELDSKKIVRLSKEDGRHALSSLRMKVGQSCSLSNGRDLFSAKVIAVAPEFECELLDRIPSTEADISITLYQGIPKGSKMEQIIQKGTEIGISSFYPVKMSRSIAKLNENTNKKLQRWQKIAKEAAKQAKRTKIPYIHMPIDFISLIKEINNYDIFVVCWEEERGHTIKKLYKAFPKAKNIGILIGPEGGISFEEEKELRLAGAYALSLGKSILRTETAGIVAGALIIAMYDNS